MAEETEQYVVVDTDEEYEIIADGFDSRGDARQYINKQMSWPKVDDFRYAAMLESQQRAKASEFE